MTELIVMYILPNIALFGGIYLLAKGIEKAVELAIEELAKGK